MTLCPRFASKSNFAKFYSHMGMYVHITNCILMFISRYSVSYKFAFVTFFVELCCLHNVYDIAQCKGDGVTCSWHKGFVGTLTFSQFIMILQNNTICTKELTIHTHRIVCNLARWTLSEWINFVWFFTFWVTSFRVKKSSIFTTNDWRLW